MPKTELNQLYSKQWSYINKIIDRKRIPSSMLFVGPENCLLSDFIKLFLSFYFCKCPGDGLPCFNCKECRLVNDDCHPDIHWISPEEKASSIKVEQIRQLQHQAYKKPHGGESQFFIIENAEKMSASVANALLKILEEPSRHSHFILNAKHIDSVLPTIISRSQVSHFQTTYDKNNILSLLSSLPKNSKALEFVDSLEEFISDIESIINGQSLPVSIASKWKVYQLSDLLWLLYIIYAQVVYLHASYENPLEHSIIQLNNIKSKLPMKFFLKEISIITTIQKKINHNINMNNQLVIDSLLLNLKNAVQKC